MKSYLKSVFLTGGLRTGLFVVCFLFAAGLLTGCGTEDKLLTELRREEQAESRKADGSGLKELLDGGQSAGAKAAQDAEQYVEAKTVQEYGQGGSLAEIRQSEQSVGSATVRNAEQSVEAVNAGSPEQSAETVSAGSQGRSVGALNGQGAEQNTGTEKIYVHVCGAVKRPGVYALPAGSRFYEAVETAGGFTGDACEDYLNMAALLADGSRLEIPTAEEVKAREEAGNADGNSGGNENKAEYSYYTLPQKDASAAVKEHSGGADASDATDSSDGLININTADMAELCSLPGVGEGRAKAIIEYREKQGGFQKKEDIMEVSGIGEKMYARMEAYLAVE